MTANLLKFPTRHVPERDVAVFTMTNHHTGETFQAVDEQGAAAKLRMTIPVFRQLKPVPAIPDTGDELYFKVDDVAAAMVAAGLDVGMIHKAG